MVLALKTNQYLYYLRTTILHMVVGNPLPKIHDHFTQNIGNDQHRS